MELESDGDRDCNWHTWKCPQKLGKGLGDLEIGRRVETIQTTELYSQNTGKSPGDLKRFAIIQIPVKDH